MGLALESTVLYLMILLLLIAIIYTLYKSQPEVIVCYFDVNDSTHASASRVNGEFREQLDFFDIYSKPTLAPESKIGRYFFQASNHLDEHGSEPVIYQEGQAVFYLPDGDIVMQVGITRPAEGNPRHIDAGDKFTYQISGGNGKYLGVTGSVIFDVKSTLREVTLVIVKT